MFQRNPNASDYIPMHHFVNTTFKNVAYAALAFIKDPNPAWANVTDCGDFPCTAPDNTVLTFKNTVFESTDTTAVALPTYWTSST